MARQSLEQQKIKLGILKSLIKMLQKDVEHLEALITKAEKPKAKSKSKK